MIVDVPQNLKICQIKICFKDNLCKTKHIKHDISNKVYYDFFRHHAYK